MTGYRHILCALDLTSESSQVLERLKELATADCKVSLLHVVEPLESAYFGGAPFAPVLTSATEMEEEILGLKKQRMQEVGKTVGVPGSRQFIRIGSHGAEIRHFAKDNNVDLILIGTHGQHGLRLVLGSTASSVLHGAPCDVLAVRIRKPASAETQ